MQSRWQLLVLAFVIGALVGAMGFWALEGGTDGSKPSLASTESVAKEESDARVDKVSREQPAPDGETKPKPFKPIRQPKPRSSTSEGPRLPEAPYLREVATLKYYGRVQVSETITGKVTFEDGSPAVGVVVRGHPYPGRPVGLRFEDNYDGRAPNLKDMPYQRMARFSLANMFNAKQARTNSHGEFVLKNLVDAQYSLVAYLPGYQQMWSTLNPKPFPGGSADLVLRKMPMVEVEVVDASGSAFTNAVVNIEDIGGREYGGKFYRWNRRARVFPVHAERVKIRALLEDFSRVSERVEIVVPEDRGNQKIRLQLMPKMVLGFKIGQEPGAPNSERLSYYAIRGSSLVQRSVAYIREQGTPLGLRYGEGTLQDLDLAAGEYVCVGLWRDYILLEETFHLELGKPNLLRAKISPFPRKEFVEVEVLGATLRELQDMSIEIGFERDGKILRDHLNSNEYEHLGDKKFSIPIYWPEEEDSASNEVRYFVKAELSKQGSKSVDFTPSKESKALLNFLPPASLRMHFTNFDGTNGWHKRLRIQLYHGDSKLETDGNRLDAIVADLGAYSRAVRDGVAILKGFSAGRYILRFSFGHYPYQYVEREITVSEGMNELSAKVPKISNLSLNLTFLDAYKNRRVVLYSGERELASSLSSDEGVALFKDILYGSYRIVVRDEEKNLVMDLHHESAASRIFSPTE